MKKAAKKSIPAIKGKTTPAKKNIAKTTAALSAGQFVERLQTYRSAAEQKKIQRYFKTGENGQDEADEFMGVKMGQVFELAKEFIEMPATEIEKLLESSIHEVRAGAVSIMDKISRNKKIAETRLKEVYDLYMRRHDRINNWDLVDLGCLYMVGRYLYDKPRNVLYKLARSKNIWERRTGILGTCYFIKQNDLDDTFKLAEILLHDKEDLIHKATGWMLRFAGAKDRGKLEAFLDKHAAVMPRTALRNALEHFDKKQREHYLALKKTG